MKLNKINIITLFFTIFVFLSVFPIEYLKITYSFYKTFINTSCIISFLIIVLIFIKNNLFRKIDVCLVMFFLVYIFTTLLNNGDIKNALYTSLSSMTISFYIEYSLLKNNIVILKYIRLFLLILISINLLTQIIYPNGMYIDSKGFSYYWLLGQKNLIILYCLPTIIFTVFLDEINNKKSIYTICTFLVSLISVFISKSATSLVIIVFITFSIFIRNIISNIKLFNIKNYVIIYFIFQLLLVNLKLTSVFSRLFLKLNRDFTLTGRIYIWNRALQLIKEKLLLGWGCVTSITWYNPQYHVYTVASHCHNYILQILFQTGIVGMIIFFALLLSTIINLYKCKNNKIINIMSLILFGYFIMMITESFSFILLFYILIFLYNLPIFLKKKGCINNED